MCIINSVYQKNKLIAKTKRAKRKTIKVWKTLILHDIDGYITLDSTTYDYVWNPGLHTKSFKYSIMSIKNGYRMSDEGFYVYLKKPSRSLVYFVYRRIVPFYANIDDLLAVGCKQWEYENIAVFSKLELKEEDYNKALTEAHCVF